VEPAMAFKQRSKVIWPGVDSTRQRRIHKVGRNDLCPCGSGRKYKDCHEKAGVAYLEKLAREEDKTHLREMRKRLKEQGVPWYKRFFLRP